MSAKEDFGDDSRSISLRSTEPQDASPPSRVTIPIAQLKDLAQKATQLPWHVDKYNCYIWGPDGEMVADSTIDRAHAEVPEESGEPIVRARGVGGGLPIAANMAYVAAAANAIPSLIERIETLEKALRYFLADERFVVSVGGNPRAVDKMLGEARAALTDGRDAP